MYCSVHPGLTLFRFRSMKVEHTGFTVWRVTSSLLRMETAVADMFRIFVFQGLAQKAESKLSLAHEDL